MRSNVYQTFLKNSLTVTGCLALTTGLFFATAGIYQFHTQRNLITSPQEKNKGYSPVQKYFADGLENMSVTQKTGGGASLISTGLTLLTLGVTKRRQ
ncbi:hypothetical protein A4D02_35395 [Niastella koreensis]|uniref:Uncharacterized protein n=1 Tax=Niastella koreensis TaxID=354356 RepID=A0ABX3NRX0_9BACT|nr:hypothetical protein A4D02_35395 [Niastella koreensis]